MHRPLTSHVPNDVAVFIGAAIIDVEILQFHGSIRFPISEVKKGLTNDDKKFLLSFARGISNGPVSS
jgi:hypothetical protein